MLQKVSYIMMMEMYDRFRFFFLVFFSHILLVEEEMVVPMESDYYSITTIPLPEGEVIAVSGIEILPGGRVAI